MLNAVGTYTVLFTVSTELYTIEGNAFGRPCHFPFKFRDEWYSDCIPGESTKRPWCSTDRDYKQSWGYCPTKCKLVYTPVDVIIFLCLFLLLLLNQLTTS